MQPGAQAWDEARVSPGPRGHMCWDGRTFHPLPIRWGALGRAFHRHKDQGPGHHWYGCFPPLQGPRLGLEGRGLSPPVIQGASRSCGFQLRSVLPGRAAGLPNAPSSPSDWKGKPAADAGRGRPGVPQQPGPNPCGHYQGHRGPTFLPDPLDRGHCETWEEASSSGLVTHRGTRHPSLSLSVPAR